MARRALILIDLQNEFLSPGGNFPIDMESKASLIQTLNTLVPAFRSAGGQIIWIRSEYAPVKPGTSILPSGNDENSGADDDLPWLVEGTHMGKKPCCKKGLFGAQLSPAVSKLFRKEDTSILKHWYSSFKETALEEHLSSQSTSHLYLGGVVSNICVLATALWASAKCPNLTAHFVKDAVGWRKESSHLRAIEALVKEDIPVVNSSEVLALAPIALPSPSTSQAPTALQLIKPLPTPETTSYGQGDTYLVEDMLPADIAKEAFDNLRQEVDWQRMYHQGGAVPRLVAVQGEVTSDGSFPIYRHPADNSPPLRSWTRTVGIIREHVERVLGHPVNHVLIQCYRSGSDYISEHSDKTLDIVRGASIVNVSVGAQRQMTLRRKRDPSVRPPPRPSRTTGAPITTRMRAEFADQEDREKAVVPLPHNSMFVLGLETNKHWVHGINQDKRHSVKKNPAETAYDGARISLTFRHIGTFLNADETLIWGQGATSKTREGAKPTISGDPGRLIHAMGYENQRSDFNWERAYGAGFDILHFTPSDVSK